MSKVRYTIETVRGNYLGKVELFSDVFVSSGGWCDYALKAKDLRGHLDRWVDRSLAAAMPESEAGGPWQCGGCRWMLALDGDYGICANCESEFDGSIIFEHGGCGQHSEAVRQ